MDNQQKIQQLIELRKVARMGGGEKRIEAQHNKGKYTIGKNTYSAALLC